MTRKGIILAGGSGTRLWPATLGVSKQLLPVFDKPMIYYPLTTLMQGGIREIAVITTPQDQASFKALLGDGSQWGVTIDYLVQPAPGGLAQAYILAQDFLAGAPSAMILGDNLFFGDGIEQLLEAAHERDAGASIFGYHVADPGRYGVVDFADDGRVRAIVEKPAKPPSSYAVTGLYFLDSRASELAARLRPSARGELEIAELLEFYLAEGALVLERLGRGYAWLDTGTHGSLLDAGNFVRTLTERQGLLVGSPDETAFRKSWIDRTQLAERARLFAHNPYGACLYGLL